jgi:hypothetical protein
MAGLDTFTAKLELLISQLPESTLDNVEIAAMDAQDLLQQRLQEQGVDAQGNPWRPYSDEYQKQKQKAGKYSGKVDFTLQDRMINNIGLVVKEYRGKQAFVVIKPRSKENQDKLTGLSEGRPSGMVPDYNRKGKDGKTIRVTSYFTKGTKGRGLIMELSKREEDLIRKTFIERMTNYVKGVLE